MDNKTKVDRLHDLLPDHLNTQNNTNWKGLLKAIGDVDQDTADLISEVRKQFFVKTANRPYIDRLAANNMISRPRFVGMDDTSFREYIPVLSYKPKQVKLIIDKLLDIFFFKESTTAFITTQNSAPFSLVNNWEFEYVVDENNLERIGFRTNEFTDMSNISAAELVAAINRQAKYSYATVYYDSITKNSYIRLFTNTVGSKGSIRITGGRANVAFRFNGFIDGAGNGSNTQWQVTKIGDLVTFKNVGGTAPGIEALSAGDIAIINLSGNVGSFPITKIDIANAEIQFKNLFATPGTFTQTSDKDVKFIANGKHVAYTNPRRAMTWETSPGEIIVEMPTSPPVVKRSLKGSFHINGLAGQMVNRDSDTSLTLDSSIGFPMSGSFFLERVNELQTRVITSSEDTILTTKLNTRLNGTPQKYTYTSRLVLSTTGDYINGSKQLTNLASTAGLAPGQCVFADGIRQTTIIESIVGNVVNLSDAVMQDAVGATIEFGGNTLTGISPALPALANLNEITLSSLERTNNIVTATSASPHGYQDGEYMIISGSGGLDGAWKITVVNATTVQFYSFGPNTGPVTPGTARVERIGLANSGSRVIISNAASNLDTRITGSYAWDLAAPFVLSSFTAQTNNEIHSGKIVRLMDVSANEIPDSGGYLIFDYGMNSQEGPVRYIYKPTNTTIALDPSYVFQKTHVAGATVTAIRSKGPHPMSTRGDEYAPYVTDPSEARIILQELIKSVKSAGIFVNFLVRYPEQLYATLDIYKSGKDPG